MNLNECKRFKNTLGVHLSVLSCGAISNIIVFSGTYFKNILRCKLRTKIQHHFQSKQRLSNNMHTELLNFNNEKRKILGCGAQKYKISCSMKIIICVHKL